MKYTIQHRRGTTSQWNTANPVLAFGEVGVENTGAGLRSKIGDGTTAWTNLPYVDDRAIAAAATALGNATEYADDGDTATLTAAKSYSDAGDAGTFASAKSYTDTKTAGLPALMFDSGLRNIDSSLYSGFTAAWVRLLRKGPSVTLHLTNLSYSGAGTGTISVLILPQGFRPPTTAYAYTSRGKSAQITASGVLQVGSPGSSIDSTSLSYLTQDPAPTTLPGTPA
ncbi:hypothetical protein [Brevibacterium sp. ZH18]|uniref:hyaluronate lyase N-terminal domain-containing protein n=1 Tax=Brevibacterium sp. ZH18 TaxID=2927784 RepID=UPI001F6060F7|nr:hypothetical protein [Brevibacterium sp. ZH18]